MTPAGLLRRLDRYQQAQPWLALPTAVLRKFFDDQAGNLAALISYYAFFSFFPLLLVLVTVLGFVAAGDPQIERRVIRTITEQFPGLGGAIVPAGQHLHGSGFGLAVGIVLALWAGLAVANAAQNAFNAVWQVPVADRPNLPHRIARSAALLVVVGTDVIVTTVISGLSSGADALGVGIGASARVGLLVVSLVLNVVLFSVAFRLLSPRPRLIRHVLPGAVLAAVGWQILQWVGGYFITSRLSSASAAYGTFAIVIGLLTWFFVLGQLILLATELNVVRARKLWPRSLAGPPVTDADRRASIGYATMLRHRPGVTIDVRFSDRTGDG